MGSASTACLEDVRAQAGLTCSTQAEAQAKRTAAPIFLALRQIQA